MMQGLYANVLPDVKTALMQTQGEMHFGSRPCCQPISDVIQADLMKNRTEKAPPGLWACLH